MGDEGKRGLGGVELDLEATKKERRGSASVI